MLRAPVDDYDDAVVIWLRAIAFVVAVQAGVVGVVPWLLSAVGPAFAPGPLMPAGIAALVAGVALLAACNVLFVQTGKGTANHVPRWWPPLRPVPRSPARRA